LAIKGKGRTRGRKLVASPPRPQLVVRKPPFWRRRWVWAVVVLAAAGGILAGVLVSLHGRSVRNFKARQIAVIQQYAGQLVAKFPADNQVVPPDLVAFFPSLTQDIQNLSDGKMKPADAIAEAKHVQSSAQAASSTINSLNLTKLIPADLTVTGLTNQESSANAQSKSYIEARGATLPILQTGQTLMSQGFALWRQAGLLMEQAATVAPAERKFLTQQATQLANEAGSLFDQGYRKLISIMDALGLQAPTPPAQIQPSPTPSASASATPSPSPSASPSR